MIERAVSFQSSTTWTVPAGVFFVYVEVCGGGGGCTTNNNGVAGTDSTVAFTGRTVTGEAAAGNPWGYSPNNANRSDGAPSSGQGASISWNYTGQNENEGRDVTNAGDTVPMFDGVPTIPGDTVTITIGAGGNSTYDGGSGYAVIRYEV